jgi:hypothetical protein
LSTPLQHSWPACLFGFLLQHSFSAFVFIIPLPSSSPLVLRIIVQHSSFTEWSISLGASLTG